MLNQFQYVYSMLIQCCVSSGICNLVAQIRLFICSLVNICSWYISTKPNTEYAQANRIAMAKEKKLLLFFLSSDRKKSDNFVMVNEIWKILDKLGKIRKLMSGNPELISYAYR